MESGNGKTVTELAPAITSGDQRLEEVERLYIENVYLRLQNLALSVKELDHQRAEIDRQKGEIINKMRELQEDMKKKRDELSAKYGTPIDNTTVTPDGIIKPKTPAMVHGTMPDGTPVSIPASAVAGGNAVVKAP